MPRAFIVKFLLVLLFLQYAYWATTVSAANLNDQQLAKVRTTLAIGSNISDETLRQVLNKEVATGVSLGEQIYGVMTQIEFGLQLKSGNYYARYQAYFNEILDNKLSVWDHWLNLGRDGAISYVSSILGSQASNTVGIFFKIKAVLDIDGLWSEVVAAHNTSNTFLDTYIGARNSNSSDEDAWNEVKDWIIGNKEGFHAYFISAWEAYHLADNYNSIIASLRDYVYLRILTIGDTIARWPCSSLPIKYIIDKETFSNDEVTAIRKAFETWSNVAGSHLAFEGLEPERSVFLPDEPRSPVKYGSDYVVFVTKKRIDELPDKYQAEFKKYDFPYPGAMAFPGGIDGEWDLKGGIIVFRTQPSADTFWSTSDSITTDYKDLQSAALHEIGHLLWLAHPKDSVFLPVQCGGVKPAKEAKTIMGCIKYGEIIRDLQEEDIKAARDLYPAGHAAISQLSVWPSPIILGQEFTASLRLQEMQTPQKTCYEKIAVTIRRADNADVFNMAEYSSVALRAENTWGQSATNKLYTTQPPGAYKVVVRGKLPGKPWFDFDTTGSGQNPVSFSAVPQNTTTTTGWVSVSQSVVSPNPVVLGQNFTVNFSLRESQGASKTFEKIAVAILRADGSLVFDAAMYDNVTVPAGGTWSRTATNYLYDSHPPGLYKVVIRGKLPNDNWFDFDGANQVNFYAAAASSIPNKITVLSPNGGEVWEPGATKLVTWATSGSMGSDVKVELYKGGTREFTIDNSDDNGQKNWNIPSDLDLGANYRIKVTSNTDPSVYDYSDANFIIDSSITVTSPNGGELWEPGTRQAITWTRSGTTGKEVKIQLYKGGFLLANLCDDILDDNGIRYVDILADSSTGLVTVKPTNCNSYSGLQLGTDYKIKITSTRNNDVFDSSDVSFSIGERTPPIITNVSINNGAPYTTSAGVTVAFSATDNSGVVSERRVSNDSCTNWSEWAPYIIPIWGWQITPGDGPRTVCVQVKDAFGNVSETKTANIYLDPTPPTVTNISINNGAQYTDNPSVTISLNASDNSGAVSQMRFSNDSCDTWGNWDLGNSDPSAFIDQAAGDTANTVIPTSNSWDPTTVDPIANSDPAAGSSTNTATPGWSNWEPYATLKAWNFAPTSGSAGRSVCVQVKDSAGNISVPMSASILLDTLPPFVAGFIWSKDMILSKESSVLTIAGSAMDEPGITSIEVSTDGGSTWQRVQVNNSSVGQWGLPTSISWSYDWQISAGTQSIIARAVDALGHVGEWRHSLTVVVRQPTNVSVSDRQLLVNGTPFIMKGVYYSPVPIGDWHGTYPFPWTWNPHGEDYYRSRFADLHTRDLSQLRQMGANAMRVARWDHDSYSVAYLDLLDKG